MKQLMTMPVNAKTTIQTLARARSTQASQKGMIQQAKMFYAATATGFEAELDQEMAKFRIAPAAGTYLRRFGVLPSQIKATGPRGHVLKGDVLQYIEANKLQARNLLVSPAETPAAKAQAVKKAAPPNNSQNSA